MTRRTAGRIGFLLAVAPSPVLAPRGWGEQSTAWFEVCDADGSEL